jgi:hypothetical protein
MVGHVFTRRPYQEVPILLLQAPAVRQSRAVLKKMHMVSIWRIWRLQLSPSARRNVLSLVQLPQNYELQILPDSNCIRTVSAKQKVEMSDKNQVPNVQRSNLNAVGSVRTAKLICHALQRAIAIFQWKRFSLFWVGTLRSPASQGPWA